MLWIGHLALGYIVFEVFSLFLSVDLTGHEQTILLLVTLIASLLPDLDFIPFFIRHKSMKLQSGKSHRGWTHAPLFYIIIAAALYSLPLSGFYHLSVIAGLISLLGHLVGDTIEYGVPWLWPFSDKRYYLHKVEPEKIHKSKSTIGYYWTFFRTIYVKNWTFYFDIICIIIALVFLIR